LALTKNSSVKITILSSAGNSFSTTYLQPASVAKAATTSQNYQVTTRDIITFDGSQSFATGTTIESYMWTISIPTLSSGCTIAAFSNPKEYNTTYVFSETLQYTPESLFPSSLAKDCRGGPVRAALTVVDSNGLTDTSQSIILPADPNLAPAASLEQVSATCVAGSGTAVVQVNNIFGQGDANIPVEGFASGGVSLTSPSETVTSSTVPVGQASFAYSCASAGVLEVTSGSLPPLFISIP
jgi:hypothetical protein